jgi:hypothetical protein
MRYQERRKAGWRIAVPVVVAIMALLSCGLLIALDARKVAAEKQFERKFPKAKTMTTVAPAFPPLEESDKK